MSTVEIACPNCDRKIKAKPEFAGRRVKCPGCQKPFLVALPEASNDDFDPDNPFPSEPLFPPAPPTPEKPKIPTRPSIEEDLAPETPAWPYSPQQSQAHVSNLPESRNYPALNLVRRVLLVLAILVAIGWAITLVILLIGAFVAFGNSAEAGSGFLMVSLAYLAGTFFSGAVTCCLLIASSELIKVILDIQENTLEAARR